MSENIKPCPFCGGEGEIMVENTRGCTNGYPSLQFVFVQCRCCGAIGGSSCITFRGRQAEFNAVELWNRRD